MMLFIYSYEMMLFIYYQLLKFPGVCFKESTCDGYGRVPAGRGTVNLLSGQYHFKMQVGTQIKGSCI